MPGLWASPPDLVCGIYLGNDDRTPLGPRKTGGVIAAPLFSQVMKEAHQDIPVHDFTPPSGNKRGKSLYEKWKTGVFQLQCGYPSFQSGNRTPGVV